MRKSIIFCLVVMMLTTVLLAQNPNETPAWEVTLPADKTARSNITVQNRCKKKHKFEIKSVDVPFLEISQLEVKVKGGRNKNVPVRFNTAGLLPKIYEGKVLVICKTCKKEPTCSQDRETLPVVLTVPGKPKEVSPIAVADSKVTGKEKDPCEKIRNRCNDLLKIANAKQLVADNERAKASVARTAADDAEKKAKTAEKDARQAEMLADIKPPSGRGSVNGGQEYTTADSAYLEIMNAQVVADYQAGKISVDEHQKRLKENTIEKARKERIKNEARLKKEAKAARKKADLARAAANKAKSAADKADRIAADAQAKADLARKAYEECVKKAKNECNELKKKIAEAARKAEEARIFAEAEKKRKAAEAARIAAEEQRRQEAAAASAAAAERRRLATERRLQRQREILQTIYRQMYELGFIGGSEIDENNGFLKFLPKFAQNSPQETIDRGSIPDDALEAFENMKLVRNPCGDNILKLKSWTKLEKMVNPRTGKDYTDNQAQRALNEMCRLLRRLGARQDALKKLR